MAFLTVNLALTRRRGAALKMDWDRGDPKTYDANAGTVGASDAATAEAWSAALS